MLISNFSPILELIVALNIAYSTIPQIAKTINDLFLKKVHDKLLFLDTKVRIAKHNLGAIDKDDVTEENKEEITTQIDLEVSDTLNIKNKIDMDVKIDNNISTQMRLYFILVSILSIGYLYIAGMQENNETFPTFEIVNLYLLLVLFCICRFLYRLKKDIVRNLMIIVFLFIILCVYYFYHVEICMYISTKLDSGSFLIHLLLGLSILPLGITIARYFLSSINISNKYKKDLEVQFNDLDEILDLISDVAKKPLATDYLNKVVQRHKDKSNN